MDIAADLALFRAERDALAFLGLLSSLYLRFDPPISRGDGGTAQPTHFQGLNIHALIVENADGEVLALEVGDLQTGFKLFCRLTPDDLATRGDYNATNRRTLDDLRRMSNIPTIRSDTYAEVHFR
jgi:hypothetical protein